MVLNLSIPVIKKAIRIKEAPTLIKGSHWSYNKPCMITVPEYASITGLGFGLILNF